MITGKFQRFALLSFALLIVGCSPAQFDILRTSSNNNGNNTPNTGSDSGGGTDTGGEVGLTTGSDTGGTTGTTTGSDSGSHTGSDTGGTTGHTGGDDCDCACEIDYPKHKKSMASAMWEDLFPHQIDADYNDFITNFRIKEKYGRKGLEKIVITFIPRGKASAYDHKLLLSLDGQLDECGLPRTRPMFKGPAKSIKVQYYQDNHVVSTVKHSNKKKDIVIFESTRDLFKDKDGNVQPNANVIPGTEFMKAYKKVRVTILVKKPQLNKPHHRHDKRKIDLRKYRMALFVKNTGKTIDLINVNPAHFDSNGYPYGMVLPTDFRYPLEQVKVDDVYDLFPQYRDYLFNVFNDPDYHVSEEVLEWYEHPAPGSTGKIFDRSLFN